MQQENEKEKKQGNAVGVKIYGMMAADEAYLKAYRSDKIIVKLIKAMDEYPGSSHILGSAFNFRISEIRLKFGYDDGYMEYSMCSLPKA